MGQAWPAWPVGPLVEAPTPRRGFCVFGAPPWGHPEKVSLDRNRSYKGAAGLGWWMPDGRGPTDGLAPPILQANDDRGVGDDGGVGAVLVGNLQTSWHYLDVPFAVG